eukprot:scaffold486520_cov20-Prasinocladus_malaysianus.AAC.1
MALLADVSGTITSALSIYDSNSYEKRKTKKHLRQFAKSHGISQHVQRELEVCNDYEWNETKRNSMEWREWNETK